MPPPPGSKFDPRRPAFNADLSTSSEASTSVEQVIGGRDSLQISVDNIFEIGKCDRAIDSVAKVVRRGVSNILDSEDRLIRSPRRLRPKD